MCSPTPCPTPLFAIGEQHTSSAIAGLLNSTAPLWTLLLAWALRDRTAQKRSALDVTIGLAGSALMVAPAVLSARGELSGVLACLAAALCYGLSYVYIDRYVPTRRYSLPTLAAYQLTAAGILTAPFAVLGATGPHPPGVGAVVPLVILGAVLTLTGVALTRARTASATSAPAP